MPFTPIPAAELQMRLTALRTAMTAADPDWSMLLLEHKISLYYLTGTMQDGVLIITPEQATYFIRRSFPCAERESRFADLRPIRSFREVAAAFPRIPQTVYGETGKLTVQKQALLRKYLPFEQMKSADGILSGLRAVKSEYELDLMRKAGAAHAEVIERCVPPLLHEGVTEAELACLIELELLRRGGAGIGRFSQPFGEDVIGICSFGENALLQTAFDSPSGVAGTCAAVKSIGSQRPLTDGDVILLDINNNGCGYHTDKSQNFFFGDPAQHPQGESIVAAHDECVRLERLAASLLVPGAIPSEIYRTVCEAVAPQWQDGFMNGAKFLGHSIGLYMDEAPVLARGFDAPLTAGMTLAIEPKIALPGVGLLGSENTYLVQTVGAQSLTGVPDASWIIHP